MPTKSEIATIKRKINTFLDDFKWFASIQNYDKAIRFVEKETKDDPLADVSVEGDYKRVTVSIYSGFFSKTPQEQAETLVHEMVHILIDPLHEATEGLLQGKLITRRAFVYALEASTSGVTEVIVRLLNGKMQYARKAFADYITVSKKKNKKIRSRKKSKR